MPKLTVVFNYPSKQDMQAAKAMFDQQGKNKIIPNLVGTAPYDAIEKCGGYEKAKVIDINQKKSDDEISGD